MCLLISSVWVYVLVVFSAQDYVFIDFPCLGVCVDCFFAVQDYVFIDFPCLGVRVGCFFLFRIICLLISPVWVYVLVVFFCSGLCVY
jgi:hypothetical protein